MGKNLSRDSIMKALDYAYEKAVNGAPGMNTAAELAENYAKKPESKKDQARSLIRWQVTKAGTTGFVTGLGGFATMPVTIPTDIAVVLYMQVRMIAAIAHLGGHNLNDDRVKALVYLCLAGNSAQELLKNAGIEISKKLATNMIKNISKDTIYAINKAVGFRLFTKFGEKGIINLGKAVPVLGGIIGGTFDGVATKAIGEVAIKAFIDESLD